MSTEIHEGKIENLIDFIASKMRITDSAYDELMVEIHTRFPELHDKKKCPNCGASMSEYIYTIDSLDCMLLLGMANIVKTRLAVGKPFTEANQVHLQKELNHYYSVPSRSTQCSKLGLIAKIKTGSGAHNRSKGWCITARGFEFLAGKPVPKRVKIWRRQIEERFDEMITLPEAREIHKELIARQIKAGREPKGDYRKDFELYDPKEWVEISSLHEGKLL